MILRTVLKYKFVELCLEAIFDKVKLNFFSIRPDPKKGEFYSRIDFHIEDGSRYKSYNHCTILDYNPRSKFVQFDFTSYYDWWSSVTCVRHGIVSYPVEDLVFLK